MQTNPYLSTFLRWMPRWQIKKINYAPALRTGRQSGCWSLKIEPYNLLLLRRRSLCTGAAAVPCLTAMRSKIISARQNLGYALARELSRRMDGAMRRRWPWTSWRRGASPSRPHRRSRQPLGRRSDEILTARSGLSPDCGLLDKPEKRAVPFLICSGSSVPTERLSRWRGRTGQQDDLRSVRHAE